MTKDATSFRSTLLAEQRATLDYNGPSDTAELVKPEYAWIVEKYAGGQLAAFSLVNLVHDVVMTATKDTLYKEAVILVAEEIKLLREENAKLKSLLAQEKYGRSLLDTERGTDSS